MLSPLQRAAVRHLVAYHFSPSDSRLSHKDWCEIMGITPNTLQVWRKGEEFSRVLDKAVKDAEESSDPFALYARQYALEQLLAMLSNRNISAAERRKTIKDILSATEHVSDAGDAVSYDHMTDEDLESIALDREVSVLAMTEEQIRGRAC